MELRREWEASSYFLIRSLLHHPSRERGTVGEREDSFWGGRWGGEGWGWEEAVGFPGH